LARGSFFTIVAYPPSNFISCAFAADAALLESAGKAAGDLVSTNAGATARIFESLGL
jgi:hypothetical protein